MMNLRTVTASRYVTPLREGGSLPAIVEADDEGLYVLKFRGAGQGAKALIAELLAGEVARLAGLPVPEIVFAELPAELARTEPDSEIRSLITASAGLNVALDYLPGSVTFDPLTFVPDVQLASAIVWFDAFVCNVDRTVRNVNMLIWHRRLWLIDHGASLYFHHAWSDPDHAARSAFPLVKNHVLLKQASAIAEVDASMQSKLTRSAFGSLVDLIPDAWLAEDSEVGGRSAQRQAYFNFFVQRLESSAVFVEEGHPCTNFALMTTRSCASSRASSAASLSMRASWCLATSNAYCRRALNWTKRCCLRSIQRLILSWYATLWPPFPPSVRAVLRRAISGDCRRGSASTGWWRREAPSSKPRQCTPASAPTYLA